MATGRGMKDGFGSRRFMRPSREENLRDSRSVAGGCESDKDHNPHFIRQRRIGNHAGSHMDVAPWWRCRTAWRRRLYQASKGGPVTFIRAEVIPMQPGLC